ncbi:transcription elongation factor Spt5 [Thermoplasmatales archaeon AK]|nr:transcription elongation factor Spt5 [Thermoplasmatales archaeon AK]
METSKGQYDWVTFDLADGELGCDQTLEVPISVRNIQSHKRKFTLRIKSDFTQRDQLVEWFLALEGQKSKEFTLSPLEKNIIEEDMDTPKGGYNGDRMALSFEIASEDGVHRIEKKATFTLVPVVVALKTTVGNEFQVARDLERRSEKDKSDRQERDPAATNEVLAIMSPYEVKGYIFVETMHPDRVNFIARGIKGYKGSVVGTIKLSEIEHYLTPKPAVTGIELGAYVELIDGPFKGEKAKVMAVDSSKEEVTVQLVESMVPIPVTVRAEAIRMLDTK